MSEQPGYGYRHQQCLIMFICMTTTYCLRSCIGVATVAMVDTLEEPTAGSCNISHQITNSSAKTGVNEAPENLCHLTNPYSNYTEENKTEAGGGILDALLVKQPYPKFKWSVTTKNVVITSFFWGYTLLQIPAGQLSHRFGPRFLLIVAFTSNSILTFCFPWAVYHGGWILGVAFRMMQGLSQAFIVPSLYGFFGQWAPLEERSKLIGTALGGNILGLIVGPLTSGLIAASPLGWPGIFRVHGILSGIVAALIYIFLVDTPALHPKISLSERQYIKNGLGFKKGQKKKEMLVPWRSIFGCRALYFSIFAHICFVSGETTLYTQIPAFLSNILQVNIQSSGLLSALPYSVMWITSFFFNWFTDWVIIKKYLSVTNARKMANTLGFVPAAIFLVVLAYVPKTVVVVEILLLLLFAFKVSVHDGFLLSFVDLAPNFADTLISISNFCAQLIGSQVLIAISFLVTDEKNEEQWRNVFFLISGLYIFTNTAYCMFGSSEKAPWNDFVGDEENLENATEMVPMITKDMTKNGTRK